MFNYKYNDIEEEFLIIWIQFLFIKSSTKKNNYKKSAFYFYLNF